MNLNCISLQTPTAINAVIYGSFTGGKLPEFVVAKGSNLELLRADDNGKLATISSTPSFSIIRSIIPFRLAGASKDYVAIGSDSGKVSILEFEVQSNSWKIVHCEIFGRSGCRRIIPGQYIASDPKGRALMVASIEKQKLVYVLNRDSNNKLTISSPLEAHKNETIVFSLCGLDVGFDNPIFALIEMEYSAADQDPTGEAVQETEKKLSYYELDLGLNHVIRKWSEPISRTANFLLAVPGGDNFPSGVLICGENWISYKHQGHPEIRTAIPRRNDLSPEKGVLITTGSLLKLKDTFFFIVQSEFGDLYKVSLELDPSDKKVVRNLVVAVFDSIQPANGLCITRTGLLYAASEFGNHTLMQFQNTDIPDAVTSNSILDDNVNEELGDDSYSASKVAPKFQPLNKLQNLYITDSSLSLSPLMDMIVDTAPVDEAKFLYTLCGQGNRSTFRTLKHGVSVSEVAMSGLPGRATGVWTIKRNLDDQFDKYVIISFANSTLVLSIGENGEVEEVTDSGFLTSSATLQVGLLADNSFIQIYSYGIRHIRADSRPSEWKSPGKRQILCASINSRQVAIGLNGSCEVVYFELDESGALGEVSTSDMGKEICCLDLGAIPEGRIGSPFLAVGYSDSTYQLLSLDPSNILSKGTTHNTPYRPTSICFVEMVRDFVTDTKNSSSTQINAQEARTLYLNIGLEKGVLIRVAVDPITGDISDPREKFLGPKAIKLCRISVQGQPGVMALSSRAWLLYNFQNRYHQDPLSYDMLDSATNVSWEACPNGIVAVSGNTMRVFTIENLGALFNQTLVPLKYTPRKFSLIPETKDVVIVETDHNEYNEAEKALIASRLKDNSSNMEVAGEGEEDDEGVKVIIKGYIPPSEGIWASCVRILDTVSGTTKAILELSNNEAAFSVCTCLFKDNGFFNNERFIIVGTCQGLIQSTRKFTQCYINVYRMLGDQLQLLHKTEVEEIPYAVIEFQGRLLVGVGKSLRLYDLGKKKLLKKAENRSFPSIIMRLQVFGDRIFVGDLSQSVFFVKYRAQENVLGVFADDSVPRFITCLCAVDYHTVACGDKFGNIFTLRFPESGNDDLQVINTGNLWDQGMSNGAPNKLDLLTHYYLGEIPTSIQKSPMKHKGTDVFLVSTLTGGIYVFIPSRSKEETTFFQNLEMFMRQEYQSLTHRDHLSFRSYYQPVKNIIDCTLCERFLSLPYAKQQEFADTVDRSVGDIIKRLEELSEFV